MFFLNHALITKNKVARYECDIFSHIPTWNDCIGRTFVVLYVFFWYESSLHISKSFHNSGDPIAHE